MTAAAADVVRTAWIHAVTALGASAGDAARTADELVRRYGEPPRQYHGLPHVAFVLDQVRVLGAGLQRDDVATVQVAAAAHDVVYRSRPGDDERESAAWVVGVLRAAGVATADGIGELVLATTDHRAGDDPVAAVLLDADLAILASPTTDYGAYVTAVRAEYAHVDDAQWRAGRSEVLRGLLARDRIYATEGGSRWEAAARDNLAAELAALTAGPAGG